MDKRHRRLLIMPPVLLSPELCKGHLLLTEPTIYGRATQTNEGILAFQGENTRNEVAFWVSEHLLARGVITTRVLAQDGDNGY